MKFNRFLLRLIAILITGTLISSGVYSLTQTNEKTILFYHIDRGDLIEVLVYRRIPVSNSQLTNTINALLAGPTRQELNRGIMSFIPRDTRLLGINIRENIAYINLSSDFLYNSYGREGYTRQLNQIVWTVVNGFALDVQILIEGRIIDYIGGDIWIGGPLARIFMPFN